MTISTTTSSISASGGNVSGQVVPFYFPVNSATDLVVYTTDGDGNETTLKLNTDYTVTLYTDGTGYITLVAATGDDITIQRSTPRTQTLDLAQGGSFSAEAIEQALDKLTKLCIENTNAIIDLNGQAAHISDIESPYYVGAALSWDNEILLYDDEILTY